MNLETKLKLQAYLDDELGEAEVQGLASWLDQDPQARALYAELNDIKTVLAHNQPEVQVPESREFYWSKIERAILQTSAKPEAELAGLRRPWWLRIFAPAMAVAVLALAAVSVVKLTTSPAAISYLQEIETPLEDTSAISFHSQSAGMTVVWVQSRGY
jgi:anti-sigma factor RsiW